MSLAKLVFVLVLRFGGPGLLVLGILDSSYLFAPWGNDLLVVAMTAQKPHVWTMLYYAAMSTIGSVLGCLLIDLTLRPLGAKGLEKHLSARRVKHVKKKMDEDAVLALTVASLAPPPFPFTPFIMAAAALQYSRVRLLVVVGVTRLVRFVILGALAMHFGKRILKWGENPVVQGIMIGIIILCVIGSVVSVVGWIRRSRSPL